MKLAAFICETRPLPELIPVINAHLKHLPPNTELFIIHGEEHQFLKALFPKAHLTKWLGSMNESEYNHLLTSALFWEKFLAYDRVLIFQTDSAILRPGIEEFYEWGYVGSPWIWQEWGGNGGCSLRDPKIMLELSAQVSWNVTFGNEDVFFSNLMYHNHYKDKLAPREVCIKWGAEAIFSLGTFCYHAIEKHLTPEQCEQIKNQYNEK